ncbi:MAG: UDP-N-acetylmuramate dehydrogenase [Lachnospiraceae bacterium]|jgi:UDP-N-acetylmuramate dehydrogenase|nr:UDP-N-acetylmuramate dehydrogenase [Lachnospiraceae bacterium]
MIEITDALMNICGRENVYRDEPMMKHTSFRIGGPADWFVSPETTGALSETIQFLKAGSVPYFILGNGSNLLVSDDGYRGVVIQIGKNMSDIVVSGTNVRAEAGALLSTVASRAAAASLTGMEFAGGIPGSIGGACVMNAGAYGGEMKDILTSVIALFEDGSVRKVPCGELMLGYRSSALMRNGAIVLEAELSLTEGDIGEIRATMDDLRERRVSKQPLDLPSAGSTFKRPEGYFAGKLIMDSGLRGYAVGGAQVSEKHCGFVVNRGGATADDVMTLIRHIQKTVLKNFGVELVPEVRFLGEFR